MSESSHPIFTLAAELRQVFSELEHAHHGLNDWLLSFNNRKLVQARCFALPPIAMGEEHEPITQIMVEPLVGEPALAAALSAYQQWFIQPHHSTKASFRLPGLLLLPSEFKTELAHHINQINHLKSEFKARVQSAGTRDQKYALVHHTLPGLITLHVYRHLVLLPHDASRLGFTWANKQIIKKIDKEALVQQLMAARHTPPPLTDALTWQQCVDREIYDIKRLPASTELRLRRPVKTHPMVNVRWQEDITPRQQQVKAHLPLLLCQDELPAITELGNYPPAQVRTRRAATITDEPVIPRLHIYPYQPKS
ncbi:DNA replication terminus site-binding protein [Oceanisphaera avium]|uniref:DNA replication terminus site-binding protein n=1 Tax=Oceanisphaera avium TaxID=1903694 RepID=A0A1Y0CVJ5_9GAMM|nr:DNA replication terminus site-binding protein [Oceanisphaera avium]ART79259.1 DNA replication terminus site-binding protein [Oceanisphaera avium]